MSDPLPPRGALLVEHQWAQAGRLSAFLVHELNNQLTAVSGYLELLLDNAETAAFTKHLTRMQGAAERARQLLDNYCEMMRMSAKTEPVNIGVTLAAVVDARRFEFEKRSLELRVEIARDLPTHILNLGHVQLALGALLDNAYEEMAPRVMGVCTVTARRSDAGGVLVEVTNMSEGPPPDPVPWHSAKPAHEHAGLGFTLAGWVAEAAGGACGVADSPPGEVRVRWELPPPASA